MAKETPRTTVRSPRMETSCKHITTMKPRTFKQRWNKTALKRILREYKASDYSFLCVASDEFEQLWKEHASKIRALAIRFNQVYTLIPSDATGECLFYPKNSHDRTIRIAFLQHEINRLSQP